VFPPHRADSRRQTDRKQRVHICPEEIEQPIGDHIVLVVGDRRQDLGERLERLVG
jgi:hypothetical protein